MIKVLSGVALILLWLGTIGAHDFLLILALFLFLSSHLDDIETKIK